MPFSTIPLSLLGETMKFGEISMVTWQDEFVRLSELHRHEVERWLEGARNANLIIDAGEAEKAFLIRWMSAGEPERNQHMPD